jgi:hypothetical protein
MNSMVGITGKAKAASSEEETKSSASPITKAATDSGVVSQGPVGTGEAPRASRPAPPPMLAREPESGQSAAAAYGSKEYWDNLLFSDSGKGYDSKRPTGEPLWKSKQLADDRTRNYESKRPAPDLLARDGGWRDKEPKGEPNYKSKHAFGSRGVETPGAPAPIAEGAAPDDWRDGRKPLRNSGESAMQAALAANPTARQDSSATDMTETNALLREVRDSLRSGVTGRWG